MSARHVAASVLVSLVVAFGVIVGVAHFGLIDVKCGRCTCPAATPVEQPKSAPDKEKHRRRGELSAAPTCGCDGVCECNPCVCVAAKLTAVVDQKRPSVEAFKVDGPTFSGLEVITDLPVSEHMRNTGGSDGPSGPGSGSGLCVWTSLNHAAKWQNIDVLRDLQKWMTNHPGGGYPSKVDKYLAKRCAELNVPVPDYVQHTGGKAEFLEMVLKTGRMPSVTYAGRDGVYYGSRVAHMVNLVYMDAATACILDNNYPGKYLWMSRDEFLSRWRDMGGGWAVCFLAPPPPPIPVNKLPAVVPAKAFHSGDTMLIQCPGGQCPSVRPYRGPFHQPLPLVEPVLPVSPPPAVVTPVARGYQWYRDREDPTYFYLYLNNVQVGAHDGVGFSYRHKDGTWSDYCDAPVPLPKPDTVVPPAPKHPDAVGLRDVAVDGVGASGACILTAGEYPKGGVTENMVPREETYTRNGVQVSRQRAFQAVTGADLVDDSAKLRLTIVGSQAMRTKVLNDLKTNAELAQLASHMLVQDYEDDEWPVAGVGLASGITCQRGPTNGRGIVLFRMSAYPGASTLLAALRKVDPLYDPSKDPDPTKPVLGVDAIGFLKAVPQWVYAAAAGVFLLIVVMRSPRK